MMKRVTWFASGMVAGAAGSTYVAKKIKKKAAALKPVNVAKSAVTKVKDKAHDLVEAVREGREAMRDKEAELKAIRDGRDEDSAAPRDVQPGQVIVLKTAEGGRRR